MGIPAEPGEHRELSAWFAEATPSPRDALEGWRRSPNEARRLNTGITFDAVLAEVPLLELAHSILRSYEQPVGPAVTYDNLACAIVLVPRGTAIRWDELIAPTEWPRHPRRPICLGPGHAIKIPPICTTAPSTRAVGVIARWLIPPGEDLPVTATSMLTSPAPLARCLVEARAAYARQTAGPQPTPVAQNRTGLPILNTMTSSTRTRLPASPRTSRTADIRSPGSARAPDRAEFRPQGLHR